MSLRLVLLTSGDCIISVLRMFSNKAISLVYILYVTPSMTPKRGHDSGDKGRSDCVISVVQC